MMNSHSYQHLSQVQRERTVTVIDSKKDETFTIIEKFV